MITIYAINKPDADHLAEVTAEMRKLGAPAIRVVACGDYYQALEGSHRLAAAEALGLTPELIVYEQGDDVDITQYDWYEPANWAETIYSAGEVAGELFSPESAVPYSFE